MPVLLLRSAKDGTGFVRFTGGALVRVGREEWAYYQSQNVPSVTVPEGPELDALIARSAVVSVTVS
jgi:hypothetical protein